MGLRELNYSLNKSHRILKSQIENCCYLSGRELGSLVVVSDRRQGGVGLGDHHLKIRKIRKVVIHKILMMRCSWHCRRLPSGRRRRAGACRTRSGWVGGGDKEDTEYWKNFSNLENIPAGLKNTIDINIKNLLIIFYMSFTYHCKIH